MVILLLVPTGVQAEWSMFGKDANHSGVADITERTIQKRTPTVSWDKGSSSEEVYSWGTSIGNFSANIIGDDYDRNVLHIAYVRAEDNGDWLRGYLVIRDGGSPGKVMWEYDLGNIRDQSNQSLETEFNDFEAAYGTPAIADFDNNGLMDIAVTTPHGRVYFFEPEIVYNSQNEGYGSEHNYDSWSYDSDITIVRSNPAITSFNGGNDLVISGIDIESNEIKVIAIDGNNGNELWKFEEAGSEISSPTVLEDGSNRKVFVSVYDNTNLEIYSIQGGSKLSGWDPKTIGTIVNPNDNDQHPMLPSIVIADITEDSGKEILVPQPPATGNGDSQLWLFKENGVAATGWSSAYELTGGGDMDATPAVGNLDSDSDLEIVAVTWEDIGAGSDNEITHVWAIGSDATLEWETEYDTDSSGGWDNDEHAISSPILAVIYDEDGKDNLDVFTCTTPRCYALDGTDGLDGGGSGDYLWYVTLEGRDNDNKIFTSPAASDVDGDGLLDFIIDGSVYSADLADLTLKSSDIVITDEDGNTVSEIEENQDLVFYPITIRNDGNHDALDIVIEVRLDSLSGTLLHTEIIDTLNSNSITNLQEFNWTAEGQGEHQIWVMCIVDEGENEEVRYDNNNASRSILVRPQYGLDLSISDSSESIDVNQTATFDIDIINMGLRTDNYTISVEVMNPYWEITYPSEISDLSSNVTTSFSVSFTPGPNVTSSVHQFTITAISQGNASRSDSVYVNIEVSQYYALNLEMPLSNQRVFPGTTFYYPVEITNNGNGDDTFDLYTSSDWGAQIRIDNSPSGSVTLAAFRTIEAELKIVVPDEVTVDDFKEISFTAISQGNNSVTRSIVSNTSIGIMMAEKAVVDVLPGEKASFQIEFLNPEEDEDDFSISIVSGEPDWENSISPINVSLSPSEKGYTWINFTAPNTAIPGTVYTMEFALSNNQILDKLNVVLEVGSIRGARLWSIDDVDLAFANPESTVYFDVRVVNYEESSLDISLNHQTNLMPEWEVVYNNESTWSRSIPSDTSTLVSIGVTAPSDAEAVETVWLRVVATVSGFEDAFFNANITVNQDFGISLSSEGTTTLLGNVTQLAMVSITNTGNGPDLFEVSYSGMWTENGTEILTFDGFETKDFSIPINSGLAAPGSQSNVFLQVNSTQGKIAGDPKIDYIDLSFIVTGMKSVGSQSIQLSPGESSSFDVVILSLIDSDSSSTRVITAVNGDVYWWTSFDNTEEFEDKQTLIVPVGQPDIFSFTVTVPSDAISGNYEFILKITDYNEPTHVSILVYNLYVSQNFDISAVLMSEPYPANPGTDVDWNIRYTNNGNGDDIVTFSVVGVPDGWIYSFTETVIEIQPVTTGGLFEDIGFTLTVPENQFPGDYDFIISAQSLGITVNLSVNLTINSVYQLSASSTSIVDVKASSGETIYYQFEITNNGNTADTILVSSTGSMTTVSSTDFQWTSKVIEPGVTESNYLKATVPLSNDGPWNAIVSISSTFDESMVVNLEYSLNANIIPDVAIENLELDPSNPLSGDKVNARFTVTSKNAPIMSVSYSIYIDGSIAGGGVVYSIEDGGGKIVTFTFMAEEGNHDFKVVLNPDSKLEETDMSNNELQMSFTVKGSSKWYNGGGNSNLAINIGIFAIILVGGAILYSYTTRENKSITKTKAAPIIKESSVNFPLILNCAQCSSRVRVARPGSFRCPSCKAVSLVDSNGKIENAGQGTSTEEKSLSPKSSLSKVRKPVSSINRRSRMEEFLSDKVVEEKEKKVEPKVKLSASEKLKLLKDEAVLEESVLENLNNTQEVQTEEPDEVEPKEVQKKSKKKKRKGPPKGGSFGPTVGGF